jgi:hypothetical protein
MLGKLNMRRVSIHGALARKLLGALGCYRRNQQRVTGEIETAPSGRGSNTTVASSIGFRSGAVPERAGGSCLSVAS